MTLALALALQSTLLTDSRLAAIQDFDDSLRQITDFCAEAEKASGVPLKVDSQVADLKVDVFVEKRPLNETLDKVAKALNCEWVKRDDGYRLEMSVPMANRERNFNTAEDEEDRKAITTYLEICKYVAQRTPGSQKMNRVGTGLLSTDDRNKILDPFRIAWEDAQKTGDARAIADTYQKYLAISGAAGDPQSTGLGRMLLQLDKPGLDRFWKGEPIIASTFPNSPYKLFPSDAYDNIYSSYVDRYGNQVEPPKSLCYILQYDPIKGEVQCSLNTFLETPKEYGGGGGSSHSGGPFGFSSTSNDVPEVLKKMPFYVDLQPWMDKDAVAAKFPQKIDNNTKDWPSIWSSGRRRLGDHLRWLHLATGIPVVAQADRSCVWNWVKLKRGYATATDYLKALIDDSGTYCKEDSGFLLARNYRFWSHRRNEAPESVWSRVEPQEVKTHMTFDQAVTAVKFLKKNQLQSRDLGYPLAKFDASSLQGAYEGLRFLGSLTNAQLNAAQTSGLRTSQLDQTAAEAMRQTILSMVVGSGSCTLEMAKYLVSSGLSSQTLNQMTFKLTMTSFDHNLSWTQEIKDGDEVLVKAGSNPQPVNQYYFKFALGENETVSQFLNIDK